METASFLIFFVALSVGFVLAVLLFKNKRSSDSSAEDITSLKEQLLRFEVENKALQDRLREQDQRLNKQEEKEELLQRQKENVNRELSIAQTEISHLQEKLESQKAELEELNQKFTKDFQLVANKLLRQNAEDFSKTHQKELADILNPLKEKIQSFEKKVEDKYQQNRDEQISLKQELKQLTQLNNELNLQAKNLTKALKADSKQQGNWGEVILERILESSGLIKDQEYQTQYSDTNTDHRRIQPDVLIKLPDDKHIIVDAKVSLVAYERFVSAENESEKEKQAKMHLESVKKHVKQLSEKNYQSGTNINTPDFVLLFIPIEPSFGLAVQSDPELYAYAWDKKVVIVSPSTLLATLRTIASVWKHERQTKNALEIADRAGSLYDKFVGFVEDMQKIEKGLNTAKSAYDDAYNKLKDGRGNLIRRTENIKTLGAKAEKSLPKELIDFQDNEDE